MTINPQYQKHIGRMRAAWGKAQECHVLGVDCHCLGAQARLFDVIDHSSHGEARTIPRPLRFLGQIARATFSRWAIS
ncbi:MAG: hypothetical protein AB8B71_14985 [Paracoccaceae bacterium]